MTVSRTVPPRGRHAAVGGPSPHFAGIRTPAARGRRDSGSDVLRREIHREAPRRSEVAFYTATISLVVAGTTGIVALLLTF